MWVTPNLKVAVVVAHPDDEAWAFGGTIAALAEAGATVRVWVATAGEGGGDPTTRWAELLASCAALGVQKAENMGWADGQLANVSDASGVQSLVARLAEWTPALVLTLGPDGGYGHLDHTTLTRWVRSAVALCPPASRPCLLEAQFAPGLLHKVAGWIRKARPELMDVRVLALGTDLPPDVVVPIASYAQAKIAAVAAHRSQRKSADPLTFLGGVVRKLLSAESYRLTAGKRPIVLHITRDLAPHTNGGLSVFVRALVRADDIVTHIVLSLDGWRPSRKDPAPALVPAGSEDGVLVRRATHPGQLDTVIDWVHQQGAAELVVHDALLWELVPKLRSIAGQSTTFVRHVHHAQQDRLRHRSVASLSARSEAVALNQADRVIEVAVLGHRLDPRRLLPQVARTPKRRDESAAGTTVLYAGRFSEIKGTDTWFGAVESVVHALPGVQILVAGGLPDSPKNERRWRRRWTENWGAFVASHVRWLGWLDRKALFREMGSATVVVVPSRAETFGLVAWEARAAASVIIASDLPSLRRTLAGYDRAFFVPPGDVSALAAATIDACNRTSA